MTIPEHIGLPIAVVVSVIAALAFWWWWPRWQVNRLALEITDPKARADVEDKFRKTVGQLLGGGAVLFGAWLAFLQFSPQQQSGVERLRATRQRQDGDAAWWHLCAGRRDERVRTARTVSWASTRDAVRVRARVHDWKNRLQKAGYRHPGGAYGYWKAQRTGAARLGSSKHTRRQPERCQPERR